MAKAIQKNSTKRALIEKANTRIVAVTATAAFVTVFCLVASRSLISQDRYQNRVINAQRGALNQVKQDLSATSSLSASYNAFIGQPQNVLGGNPQSTTGSKDGSNAKIVLDALPGSYDFPALVTSLESLLTSQSVTINSIAGTDQSTQQQATQSSVKPQPIAMPFQISVAGSYSAMQSVISAFENSIRPFQIQTADIAGDQNNLTITLSAQTFYQPQKNLTTITEIIK